MSEYITMIRVASLYLRRSRIGGYCEGRVRNVSIYKKIKERLNTSTMNLEDCLNIQQ